eukprot:357931-Chlamydomonas_euryale.AAC.3
MPCDTVEDATALVNTPPIQLSTITIAPCLFKRLEQGCSERRTVNGAPCPLRGLPTQHNSYKIGQPWRHWQRRQHLRPPHVCVWRHDTSSQRVLLVRFEGFDPRGRARPPLEPGLLRRDIGHALDALACGWVDCLDALRPIRPARF